MQLQLQAFTCLERGRLLPELGCAIDNAGGWLLYRKPVSASSIEIALEVQLSALHEIYAALVGSGIEFTRDGHKALTERCNFVLHLPPRQGIASIVSMRIEIQFMMDSYVLPAC